MLLSLKTAKMDKSTKWGYRSCVLHLRPHVIVHGLRTCPWAGLCAATCLDQCGRLRLQSAQDAMDRRTHLLATDPELFRMILFKELRSFVRSCERSGVLPTCRLNGTSDIPWHKHGEFWKVYTEFRNVQFVEYTKDPRRCLESDLPSNLHLTYSVNENTPQRLIERILTTTRRNVAKVFAGGLPEFYMGFPVISGDMHDLRHLDPRGHVVGLKYKRAFHKRTRKMMKVPDNGFITINKGKTYDLDRSYVTDIRVNHATF